MSILNKDISDIFKRKKKDNDPDSETDETTDASATEGDGKKQFGKKKESGIPVGGNVLIDLTPASYIEVIALRRYKKRWIYTLLMILGVSGLAFAIFYAQFVAAGMQLSAEQDLQSEIDSQIAEYSDVNETLQQRDTAENALTEVGSAEIDWNEAYGNIQSALPSDTNISRMAVDVNENPGAMVAAAVTVDLSAGSTMSYSDALGVVRDMEEVSSVTIGDMTRSGEGQYTFSMAFTYDQSIQTGRFDFTPEVEEMPMPEDMMPEDDMMMDDDMMMEDMLEMEEF